MSLQNDMDLSNTMDHIANLIMSDLNYSDHQPLKESQSHHISNLSVDQSRDDYKKKAIASKRVSQLDQAPDSEMNRNISLSKQEECEIHDCELDQGNVACLEEFIGMTLCKANLLIQSDPRCLFTYKMPKSIDIIHPDQRESDQDDTPAPLRGWSLIGNFNYNTIIGEIRDFIGQWHLSPETKCVVLSNSKKNDVEMKGQLYYVDAHFSKPTAMCPNPLPVAKVRFIISVSSVLPKWYPVMVTYRFEGYNTLYYALGDRAIKSFTFQRFYIDSIMHSKLAFYAEICECRHGTVENPKTRRRNKPNKTETITKQKFQE